MRYKRTELDDLRTELNLRIEREKELYTWLNSVSTEVKRIKGREIVGRIFIIVLILIAMYLI